MHEMPAQRCRKPLGSNFGLKTLREKRVKISTLEDLNDPFELLAYEMTLRKKRKEWRNTRKVWGSQHGVMCLSKTSAVSKIGGLRAANEMFQCK
jgi:hypothetical protein